MVIKPLSSDGILLQERRWGGFAHWMELQAIEESGTAT
jgi:hypothetical protein